MDKKQKTMLVSILIVLLLIVFLTGYTFAKYYSTYSGEARTEIAKWNFKVNGWSSLETEEIPLINTADTVSLEEGKIAPGAGGKFEIGIDASNSDVDVKYCIEATETGNKPSNLVFSVNKDGVKGTRKYSSISELAQAELNGVIRKAEENKTENLEIVWEWPYETGNDENTIFDEDIEDTKFGTGVVEGKEDMFDYSFSLKVIGTQAKVTD